MNRELDILRPARRDAPRRALMVAALLLPTAAIGHPRPAIGLSAARPMLLLEVGSPAGNPASGDRYGCTLAVGDFDRNSYSDLMIGRSTRDTLQGPLTNGGAAAAIVGHLFVDGFESDNAGGWSAYAE